jgi:hypothetical protein
MLLSPGPATKVVLEVLAQDGAAVADGALRHTLTVVGQVSGKPTSTRSVSVAGGARSWSADDLIGLADGQGKSPQGAQGEAVLHLEFLHGTYQGDDSVLGIAVRGDVLAVFTDRVEASGTLLVSAAVIEDAVLMHETGHLLGLVDLALHSGRGDPEHPGHSTNRRSVMYWAIESDVVIEVLSGPPPTDFDDADRRDVDTLRRGG